MVAGANAGEGAEPRGGGWRRRAADAIILAI